MTLLYIARFTYSCSLYTCTVVQGCPLSYGAPQAQSQEKQCGSYAALVQQETHDYTRQKCVAACCLLRCAAAPVPARCSLSAVASGARVPFGV